jgi:beta-aspartyl-peptidase (threonine type)
MIRIKSCFKLVSCIAWLLAVSSSTYAAEDTPTLTDSTLEETASTTRVETFESQEWTLIIHGGAGVISPQYMSSELELAYRQGLEQALQRGGALLKTGGSALDAVELAVTLLEDYPLFNAGVGSVLNAESKHELDASIMDGRDLNLGAVAGVKTTLNPVKAARMVLEHSEHVMFAGEAADALAKTHKLPQVKNSYFTTQNRVASLKRVLNSNQVDKADKRGTVGAVAIDKYGNIAAATSTGGMTAKAPGRVGDSPLSGAGIYADNDACGVSTTGHGEYFIRALAAKYACDRIEMLGESAAQAGRAAIDKVENLGGDGGMIIMSPNGESAFVFNTPGMFRGKVSADGDLHTRIYRD